MDTEIKTGSAFGPMTISDADFKRMVNFIQSTYGIDLSQKKIGRASCRDRVWYLV